MYTETPTSANGFTTKSRACKDFSILREKETELYVVYIIRYITVRYNVLVLCFAT